MIGLGSIKQAEKVTAEVTKTLTPVPLFAGGITTATVGAGVIADPDGGRLMLAPGVYLVFLTVRVTWTHAPSLTLAVVVGEDTRFNGPRATLEAENGAEAIVDSLPARKVDWDHSAAGTATAFGVVTVPPGHAEVPCEVYISAETRHKTQVTASRGELVAVLLARHTPEANS